MVSKSCISKFRIKVTNIEYISLKRMYDYRSHCDSRRLVGLVYIQLYFTTYNIYTYILIIIQFKLNNMTSK